MSDEKPNPPEGRRVREYHRSRGRDVGNAIMSVLVRAGVVPGSYLLTVKGRKTGKPRTLPVTLAEYGGKQWLVAPYGTVAWVHNARAAGEVTLTRRSTTRAYGVREVTGPEAGPVLKEYVKLASATRPYFAAQKDDPVEAFTAEADRHPVELIPR